MKINRVVIVALFAMLFVVMVFQAGIYWNTKLQEDDAERSSFIGVEVESDTWYHITKVVDEGSIRLYLQALSPTEIQQDYTESLWLFVD